MLQRTPPLSRTSSRAIALYALLASFTVSAQSPPLETLDQAQAFALSVVVQADTDEAKAFELIKAHTERAREYSTISLAELDAIGQQFSTNAPQRLVGMGKPTGNVEFISKKQAGENMVRLSYMQHRLRFPMLWTFDFYRTPGGWTLTAFNADGTAPDLLAP